MTSSRSAPGAGFHCIDPAELKAQLAGSPGPLVLDVRREAAFQQGSGIPGALPFFLDRDPILLPDVSRDRLILVYCL